MYKIRVTTTVEQLDHNGRTLFSVTDTTEESSIGHPDADRLNNVDAPAAFSRGMNELTSRMRDTLSAHFNYGKRVSV